MEDLPIINVYYDPPPIPVPSLFWVACIFDECDEDSCEGRGATAEEAVADFLSQLEDRGDTREAFHIELGYHRKDHDKSH
jgi:hypothetical protein